MKKTLFKILSDLINIDSQNPPGNSSVIAEYIYDYLICNTNAEVYKQNISKDKINIIAKFGKARFVLIAHLDTVPASNDWSVNPFCLKEDMENYYGLGIVDVKGAISIILYVLSYIQPNDFLLLFNADEESGNNEGIRYFLNNIRRWDEIELAIVTEPTLLNVITKHNGICNLEIAVHGKQVHSCVSESGINAIERATIVLNRLIDYKNNLKLRSEKGLKPSLNIAKVEGGIKCNLVPDKCCIKVSRRYTPDEDINLVKRGIIELFKEDWINIVFKYETSSFRSSASESLIKKLYEYGCFNDTDTALFWSEAALLNEAGISAVVIGPGNILQAHTSNEFIKKDQLNLAVNFYENLFNKGIKNEEL